MMSAVGVLVSQVYKLHFPGGRLLLGTCTTRSKNADVFSVDQSCAQWFQHFDDLYRQDVTRWSVGAALPKMPTFLPPLSGALVSSNLIASTGCLDVTMYEGVQNTLVQYSEFCDGPLLRAQPTAAPNMLRRLERCGHLDRFENLTGWYVRPRNGSWEEAKAADAALLRLLEAQNLARQLNPQQAWISSGSLPTEVENRVLKTARALHIVAPTQMTAPARINYLARRIRNDVLDYAE